MNFQEGQKEVEFAKRIAVGGGGYRGRGLDDAACVTNFRK